MGKHNYIIQAICHEYHNFIDHGRLIIINLEMHIYILDMHHNGKKFL